MGHAAPMSALLGMSLAVGLSCASLALVADDAGPPAPLVLRHAIRDVRVVDDAAFARFSLRVENRGDAPLREVGLVLVPLAFPLMEPVRVEVGDLGAGEERETTFPVVTPFLPGEPPAGGTAAFLWAVRGRTGEGEVLEFPAQSRSPGDPAEAQGEGFAARRGNARVLKVLARHGGGRR